MKKWLITLVFVLCVLGCTKEIDNQGKSTWKLDIFKSAKIEAPIEAGANLLTALAPVLPYAGTAGVALLTALGIYRKTVKPQFEEAKTEANLYHTSTHTLVAIIEDIKIKQPDLWAKLKPYMIDANMSKNIQNVILALRGLPPLE